MSVMIEVRYKKPANSERERGIVECVSDYDGALTYREDDTADSVCLTIEFRSWELARRAATKLRESGAHIEGPMDYGDD